MTTITDRLCQAKVAKRTKFYDSKCRGFYVSITKRGVATFAFKFTNPKTKKRDAVQIGVYHPELLDTQTARAAAYHLKGRVGTGEEISAEARKAKAQEQKLSGVKVSRVIDEYVEWLKVPVRKADGEMRSRMESWKDTEGYLDRYARPRLGHMVASEVTNHDIARLQADLVEGKLGRKPSISNARLTRIALSGLFKWAAQAGRSYVTASPCVNLPPLDKLHPRTRVLTADEIRIFWHGLDRPDLPCSRKIALAMKFMLATMLRGAEVRGASRAEIAAWQSPQARLHVPMKRVKKRRPIVQPLSDLAQEIVAEAMRLSNGNYLFAAIGDQPLAPTTMSHALRGVTHKGKVKQIGLCEWLGLRRFTPHDLRRTAASLAREIGQPLSRIALCLDHQSGKVDNVELSGVTATHYAFAPAREQIDKRETLDVLAAALRKIIDGDEMASGGPATALAA